MASVPAKYVPPALRATRSDPGLASASAGSPASSSTSLEGSTSSTRRWSVPDEADLTACQPVLADRFSREQASIFTKLWREHQISQLYDPQPGMAALVDAYKRTELEFRIWLVSQVNAPHWRELTYNDMHGISMTNLQFYKQQILRKSIRVPAEVLALLKEAIKGRERVQVEYSSMESSDEGHEHHIKELQRIYNDLSAPVATRLTAAQIRSISWR